MSPFMGSTAVAVPRQRVGGVAEILEDAFRRLGSDVVAVLPILRSGVPFLPFAGIAVTLITATPRVGLRTRSRTASPSPVSTW